MTTPDMEVSENRDTPKSSIFIYFHGIFPYKSSIWGFHHVWNPPYCNYRPLEISIPKTQVPWWNQRPAHGLGFSNLLVGPVRRDRWMISQCGETMTIHSDPYLGVSKNQRWMVSQVPQLSQRNICPICICDSWKLNEIHELRKCFGMLSFLKTELLCQWTRTDQKGWGSKARFNQFNHQYLCAMCIYIYIYIKYSCIIYDHMYIMGHVSKLETMPF